MTLQTVIVTGMSAAVFAAMFLFGERMRPLSVLGLDKRSLVSVSGGVAMAYVFVHVLPELADARETFVSATRFVIRFEGMAIYALALAGFLGFYSLEHLGRKGRNRAAESQDATPPAFDLQVLAFAVYVALIAYLLVRQQGASVTSTVLYALAMACHFLAADHTFVEDGHEAYLRRGRFILAGAAVIGWAAGLAIALPADTLAMILGFLSGGIIVNAALAELPSDKRGRLIPFLLGGLLYGALLLPLG